MANILKANTPDNQETKDEENEEEDKKEYNLSNISRFWFLYSN